MGDLFRHSLFFGDEEGATAIEYGLIASLVVIFMLSGLTLFGAAMNTMFSSVATQVGDVLP